MKQCQYCKATFATEDAYQIHLGIGAPAFHACNDATEMQQKGMTQNQAGEWSIDESLIEHQDNWAYLRNPSIADALVRNAAMELAPNEVEPVDDETGTHPPDCRCAWCEPLDRLT